MKMIIKAERMSTSMVETVTVATEIMGEMKILQAGELSDREREMLLAILKADERAKKEDSHE